MITKNLQKYDFDDMAHWSELVASVAWAISLKDVDKNNIRENSSRIHHDYQVGDKVLITSNSIHRKLNCLTKGSYSIVQVYSNGTVRVQNGAITEHINIGHCSPYTG